MDGKELDELRELVEFLKANGIGEFDMERADLKVRIKFAGEGGASGADIAQLARLMASGGGIPSLSAAGAAPAAAAAAAEAEEALHEVKSPIVGTFYESP